MGLAVISANTTIKVSTGGSFNITATATPVTTAANEYAKVKIAGYIFQAAAGVGNSMTLAIAGNTIRSLATSAAGDYKTISSGDLRTFTTAANVEDNLIEVIVPPSSSLVVTKVGATSTMSVVGVYQKFINSP